MAEQVRVEHVDQQLEEVVNPLNNVETIETVQEDAQEVNPLGPVGSVVPTCRVCWDVEIEGARDPLIKPCLCAGSIAWIHFCCLERWIETSRFRRCPSCRSPYQGIRFIDVISVASICSLAAYTVGLYPPQILYWTSFILALFAHCWAFIFSRGNSNFANASLTIAGLLFVVSGIFLVFRYRKWKSEDGFFYGRIFRIPND